MLRCVWGARPCHPRRSPNRRWTSGSIPHRGWVVPRRGAELRPQALDIGFGSWQPPRKFLLDEHRTSTEPTPERSSTARANDESQSLFTEREPDEPSFSSRRVPASCRSGSSTSHRLSQPLLIRRSPSAAEKKTGIAIPLLSEHSFAFFALRLVAPVPFPGWTKYFWPQHPPQGRYRKPGGAK